MEAYDFVACVEFVWFLHYFYGHIFKSNRLENDKLKLCGFLHINYEKNEREK